MFQSTKFDSEGIIYSCKEYQGCGFNCCINSRELRFLEKKFLQRESQTICPRRIWERTLLFEDWGELASKRGWGWSFQELSLSCLTWNKGHKIKCFLGGRSFPMLHSNICKEYLNTSHVIGYFPNSKFWTHVLWLLKGWYKVITPMYLNTLLYLII